MVNRRGLLRNGVFAAALVAGRAFAEPVHDTRLTDDFDELWRTLSERYCFFAEKRTDWDRVRALYRPMAASAQSLADFTEVVRLVLAELYDAHTHLSDPPDGTPRWPLFDLLATPDGEAIRIVAVAPESAAADAGLVRGDRILALEGKPAPSVLAGLLPRCLRARDAAAMRHAANVAVAGRRGQGRLFTVEREGGRRDVAVPLKRGANRPDVAWRRLDGGIGCIAIRSFAEARAATDFDDALAALRDSPALIIDVRGNGGGDTAVARPIMGRFIERAMPYAMMRRRAGKGLGPFWTEYVEPSGPFTFRAPVAVVVDHWSGSMAEGFPMGMRSVAGARIVGTPMMGLGAAVFPLRLDRTGIEAQYSAEPVYDIGRRPRWELEPDVEVPEGGDPLAAAMQLLHGDRTR